MNNLVQVDINSGSNIVSLIGYKSNQKRQSEEKSASKYYNLLGFNELINEAQSVILELDNKDLTYDLALKSKSILNEFKNRSKGLNPLLSKAISDIAKSIETNISGLVLH